MLHFSSWSAWSSCAFVVIVSQVSLVGCGSDSSSAGPELDGGNGGDGATDLGGDGLSPSDASLDTNLSGLGDRCDGTCPAGLRCVEGTCHRDCGSAPHCGAPELCCASGQVCAAGACVSPGAACTPFPGCGGVGTTTCAKGSYCDSVIGKCLPSPTSTACTLPVEKSFSPELLWWWKGHGEFKGVLVNPVVADVNHDGASDVIVVAYRDPTWADFGSTAPHAILCALSGPGDCGGEAKELFCSDPKDVLLNGWGNLAVGDLDDGDGSHAMTIIAGVASGGNNAYRIVAFDEKGKLLWTGHEADGTTPTEVKLYGGGPSLADLDGDGKVEIVVGATVFDNTGKRKWSKPGGANGNAGFGPISIVADLDGASDGKLEVMTGNVAYAADGTVLWTAATGDGYDAVADFDGDGKPEVVIVSSGTIGVFDGATGKVFAPVTAFTSFGVNGKGGAPTVADFDGDGVPDIGVAAADHYMALKVTTTGATHAVALLWSAPADDASSQITGSAMFDFDGDGQFEVTYQDTCKARVFDGKTGAVRFSIDNNSGTATNYPTVADLNGDGRAEFILVTDSYYARAAPSTTLGCPAIPTSALTDGVKVYRDKNDNWQTTRAIWNQHAYAVTNVCDGVDAVCTGAANVHGAIPRKPPAPWSKGLDAFRVNARFGLSDRNAPDLVVLSLSANLSACPSSLTLRADVGNEGAAAVAAGIPVSFYDGAPGSGSEKLLGTVTTTTALPAGGVQTVTLVYAVPAGDAGKTFHVYAKINDDGKGGSKVRECKTDNDTAGPTAVACTAIR